MTPFPGGVGISGLSVYDWETVDGVCGGSPHVHLVCSEAYVVVAGEGRVQTLTGSGPGETPLAAGTVAWFTPGTVHRLINDDGRLRIVVIMQNDGLPEAGDAVFTFPPKVLADPDAYAEAAVADSEPAAKARRDLAIEGFLDLRRRGPEGLAEFHRAAVRLKAGLLPGWRRRWQDGPLAAAHRTAAQLESLNRGEADYLMHSELRTRTPQPKLGMCGRLDTYRP